MYRSKSLAEPMGLKVLTQFWYSRARVLHVLDVSRIQQTSTEYLEHSQASAELGEMLRGFIFSNCWRSFGKQALRDGNWTGLNRIPDAIREYEKVSGAGLNIYQNRQTWR
ncbi:hypothetical protein CHARACLAT_030422 [Characodon lateralis]|uniref:Uncharacterized protein n=1 Tax=Characodon lateralis TaxID=208331 RepID=A0ABU7EYK2_9TELE|nr:hypothetical protein [Characodon lateralis]